MKLIPVDPANEEHLRVLYDLLAERPKEASISHKKMPTWEAHVAFVARAIDYGFGIGRTQLIRRGQYLDWCLLQEEHGARAYTWIGAVYLTKQNEIGISVFKYAQGKGFGSAAVGAMMDKHGARRYLANVNPANEPSRKMFEKLGFKLIQHTYALEAE